MYPLFSYFLWVDISLSRYLFQKLKYMGPTITILSFIFDILCLILPRMYRKRTSCAGTINYYLTLSWKISLFFTAFSKSQLSPYRYLSYTCIFKRYIEMNFKMSCCFTHRVSLLLLNI